MIDALIRWCIHRRFAVVALSAALLLFGGLAAWRMPVDVFPDLTAPTVTVLVEGHGLAPLEMETLVTFPIETAVNGAAQVRRVRSATAVGIAVIWVEFEWGADIYQARQTVTERLASVSGSLPSQVAPPMLAPVSSIMGEILFASLTSTAHSQQQLRTTATTLVRRRLLSVAGVSQVTPIGGDTRQYQVVLAPARLRSFGIAAEAVVDALAAANENVSAGFLVRSGQESLIEGIGRIASVADIGATVVAVRGGRAVTVADLGVVGVGAAIKRGTAAASRRGPGWEPITEPGIILAVQKQPGANTLELTQRLDRAFDDLQTALPAGMTINRSLFRQADFIAASVGNTTLTLVEGALMVLLVVVLFLASFRASFITLLAIPLSLVSTVLVLQAIGATINTMTLGGMAIAIGALVDDAIIGVENVVRRLREEMVRPVAERRPALAMVHAATSEVRTSVVFATLIILLVFTPLFALGGIEGRLLKPLGVAFTVSLGASLLVALTLTPALCYFLLPNSRTVVKAREPALVRGLKRLYGGSLRWAMQRPLLLTGGTLALLALAVLGFSRLGRNFLPEFNEGALVVGLVTAAGSSLEESDKLANLVEQALMRHPEIVGIGRRTGRAEEDEHVQGVEASEIDLSLDMQAPARLGGQVRSKPELLAALRADVAAIPGVQATFGQPISHRIDHMLSGTRANVAVKIFGDDLGQLRELARQVQAVMGTVPGVVDLSTEQQVEVATVRVDLDRPAIARYGLQARDVMRALERTARGEQATQVLEGSIAIDLVVRVGDGGSERLEAIAEAPVDVPGGPPVPLRALARVSEDLGPNMISRENVQRRIVVMCNVAGRDMRSVVDDIEGRVQTTVPMPPGCFVEYGGQFESAAETGRILAMMGAGIVAGMVILLYLVLRSLRDALLVMVNLPLALIGGVLGVHLSGGVLSVASIIGFITVFGVAARNGIMMVSHIRHLQHCEGVTEFRAAVERGAKERMAPILMTALAAGLALVPLALRGDQPGNEILTPMAIVILCGLMSSTFLNMLVMPAMLVRFGKGKDGLDEPDDGPEPAGRIAAAAGGSHVAT